MPVSNLLLNAMQCCGLYHENWQVVSNVVDDFFYTNTRSQVKNYQKEKRFRFVPLLYDLNVFVTYEDEDIISVLLTVRICRGAENVKVMTDAHMWQVTDAKLLPPKQVYDLLRVKRPSNKKMRKCVGISYDGKTLKQYEKKYEKKKSKFDFL